MIQSEEEKLKINSNNNYSIERGNVLLFHFTLKTE